MQTSKPGLDLVIDPSLLHFHFVQLAASAASFGCSFPVPNATNYSGALTSPILANIELSTNPPSC
jgi:hypothetical protein